MTNLTELEIEKIERLLGFSSRDLVVYDKLIESKTTDVYDRVIEIFTSISKIELLLNEALEFSLIDSSRAGKINYKQHIHHLRLEGRNLLEELASILDIYVRKNKFGGEKKTVSYW